MRAARIASALACLIAAGCAAVERGQPPPTQPAVQPVPPPTEAPAARAAPTPPPPVAPVPPAAAIATAPPRPPATGPVAAAKPATPPRAPAPAAMAASATPTPPTSAPPAPKPGTPTVAPKPSAPPLDLASLETRLRDTKAIGVFTKISLKNQVDDLLNKFRAYYKRQTKVTLAELRKPYDMLLLKVLSLLQDSDPPLARDIVASREAIWGILSDPEKFNEAKLMAGETP